MARTQRPTGRRLIISYCGTPEARRRNNASFQTRLQETRRAHLPTQTESSNTSDGDHSPGGHPPAEEPPD